MNFEKFERNEFYQRASFYSYFEDNVIIHER